MRTEGAADSTNWDAYPRISDGLEIHAVGTGYVVYQPDRERMHYLNHTSAILLELCNGKTRVAELPELLMVAYQLTSPPTAEVSACIASLYREGLIR